MPATANCRDLFNRGGHVLVGVSPFNSRFSDAHVARLLNWANQAAPAFDVLLAGDEAAFLLEALGAPAGKARRKARKAVGRNRRSVEAALRDLGVSRARVHTFSDFSEEPGYLALKHDVTRVYNTHSPFRHACLDMSRQVVTRRSRTVHMADMPIPAERIELAARYVLAELPFFLNTPAILGTAESLLAYHRPWDLGERIFAGDFPIAVSERQGYLTLVESVPTAPEPVAEVAVAVGLRR